MALLSPGTSIPVEFKLLPGVACVTLLSSGASNQLSCISPSHLHHPEPRRRCCVQAHHITHGQREDLNHNNILVKSDVGDKQYLTNGH